MRIGLVWISQETDTFNPQPTTVESFAAFGIERGDAIIEKVGNVGMIGGYVEAAKIRGGIETVPIFKARSVAGGRLSSDTLSFLSDELESGLRSAGSLDGVALRLHGACAAEGVDDVEVPAIGDQASGGCRHTDSHVARSSRQCHDEDGRVEYGDRGSSDTTPRPI